VITGPEAGYETTLEDLEITGASGPAVVFAAGSRGVLRASYLHDNAQVAVEVLTGGRPSLLQNVITANGKGVAGAARVEAAETRPPPAVLLHEGASATLFGNVIAGNADDQVAGLPAEKKADVLRDNVIGLPAPPRAATAAGARRR
jgi:hypothetical protein